MDDLHRAPHTNAPKESSLSAPADSAASEVCFAARLTEVSRLFGSFAALRGVSWTFPMGHATAVLGENGAGKSTLLRTLAGLTRPTRGGAELPLLPDTAYMSHDAMLYDELTARENLLYFAAMYPSGACMPPGEALAAVGLDASLDRRVGKYSQGMRQRVSLARVLLSRPRLLLLDEPFSNLDRAGALAVIRLLRGLREAGRAIVFTTHQAELAAQLADTTLRMSRGVLLPQETAAA